MDPVQPPTTSLMRTDCALCRHLSGAHQHTCCLRCRDFSDADTAARDYKEEFIEKYMNDCRNYGIPLSKEGILRAVAQEITSTLIDRVDIARALFTWISLNIKYEAGSMNFAAYDVFKNRRCVCRGYASLFWTFASAVDLPCEMIIGRSKLTNFLDSSKFPRGPKSDLLDPSDEIDHGWNVVQLDDRVMKLMDVTWGSNGEIGLPTPGVVNVCYFSMSNDEFFLQHFPADRPNSAYTEIELGPGSSKPPHSYLAPNKKGKDVEASYPQWSSATAPPTILNSHLLDIVDMGKLMPVRRLITLVDEVVELSSSSGDEVVIQGEFGRDEPKIVVQGVDPAILGKSGPQHVMLATFRVSVACTHLLDPVTFFLKCESGVKIFVEPDTDVLVNTDALSLVKRTVDGKESLCVHLWGLARSQMVEIVEWQLPDDYKRRL